MTTYLVSITTNSDHKWIREKIHFLVVSKYMTMHFSIFFVRVDLIMVCLFIVSYADFFITIQQSYFFAYNGLRFWSTT